MNSKLRELADLIRNTKGMPDTERYEKLAAFCYKRDRAPSWYDRLPQEQKGLWAEVRADIVVGLCYAAESLSWTPEERERNSYGKIIPFKWDALEALAAELAGEVPNRSTERWVEGVRARTLQGLGQNWTKAHARKVVHGLLQTSGHYKAAYRDLAEWAIAQGTGE